VTNNFEENILKQLACAQPYG